MARTVRCSALFLMSPAALLGAPACVMLAGDFELEPQAGAGGTGGSTPTGQSTSTAGGGAACADRLADCDEDGQGECETNLDIDANNCGACGVRCVNDGRCEQGACSGEAILADGLQLGERSALALHGDELYIANGDAEGSVVKLPKTGGKKNIVPIATRQPVPEAVAVDATDIYWANSGNGTVHRQSRMGGSPTPFAETRTMGKPVHLALNAEALCWTQLRQDEEGVTCKPLDGGEEQNLHVPGQSKPTSVAMSEEAVFWTDTAGLLFVARLGGTDIGQFASGQSGPHGITLAGGQVYWLTAYNETMGDVLRKSKDSESGALPDVLGSEERAPHAVAVGQTHVFWTNSMDGTVRRVPIGGNGGVETVAGGQETPTAIAIDEAYVYWLTRRNNGSLHRHPVSLNR